LGTSIIIRFNEFDFLGTILDNEGLSKEDEKLMALITQKKVLERKIAEMKSEDERLKQLKGMLKNQHIDPENPNIF